MLSKIDFKFYKENLFPICALVVSIMFIQIFDLKNIMENTFLENLQVLGLFFASIYSFKAKKHKVFYNFISLVLILMFLRELSYGRVFYGHIPNAPSDAIYPLSHFKYGYLNNIIVALYISGSVLYALFNKIWVDVIDIIKQIQFPFWTFFIAFSCVAIQIISEKTIHNTCIEETSELVLYFTILALVLIYIKKDK